MKRIRKSRFADPDQELSRLRARGIVTKEIETKMRYAVRYFSHGDKMKALLGDILEIQNLYGSTHHVLVHAQSSNWLVYPDLVKELMKLNHPEKDLHQFKFLRMPQSGGWKGIERYSKANSVNDHESRAELISCDGYFFNNQGAESALDFLSSNYNINIMDGSESIQKLAGEAIRSFYPKIGKSDLESFSKKITESAKKANLGNLFVFCIPKEKSAEVQYRSHPFGQPCQCHKKKDDAEILDQLQEGNLNDQTRCSGYYNPQFRIYTPALKKENGVKVYLLASDQKQRKEEKLQVRSLAQQLHENQAKRKDLTSLFGFVMPYG
jgi:hypothetical protein